jgi:hypothetical protein
MFVKIEKKKAEGRRRKAVGLKRSDPFALSP